MELQTALNQFQSPLVKDLAWAILSPTLLQTDQPQQNFPDSFFQKIYHGFHSHLKQLDSNPEPLRNHLAQHANHRLGYYFEQLWRYWCSHNSTYQLLAHNVQIRSEGTTLGEFDMIVENSENGEIEHWELAIKFYLGISPLSNADHWFGPHLKDRLDLKYQRLQEHQLKLSTRPEALEYCQSRNWHITKSRLICKGRLFYPQASQEFANNVATQHLKGSWLTTTNFLNQYADRKNAIYYWLEKDEWMVPRQQMPHEFSTIKYRLAQQPATPPVQLLVMDEQDFSTRLFIVPDSWPERALASLG